jgi:folate-binding Fe-S cluster repair protein YgfZ
MTQAVYTKLPDRAFICITGDDRRPFLQGLITQDIDILDTSPHSIHAFLPLMENSYSIFLFMKMMKKL